MTNRKRYLFFLGHPAHFHLFKYIIERLNEDGHKTLILIRSKDVLRELCQIENIEYTDIFERSKEKVKHNHLRTFYFKYKYVNRYIRSFRPDILLGSEPTLAHLGRLYRIPSFIFSEDDVHIIPQFAKISYPFVDVILSPITCDAGKWTKKKVAYDGFHKLAYLHPKVFSPDRNKIKEIGGGDFFIIRMAELVAYHDKNRKGLTRDILIKLITLLEPHGKIFITSEKKLDEEFEKYRLRINPAFIHHALYFAKLYIGDSQSMAVESALLGTPGIRFNDFSGEIGVLNELENKYHLTTSIRADKPDVLFSVVSKMMRNENLHKEYMTSLKRLLDDKINVFAFFVWFIENYPESKKILGKDPDYQYRFK